MDAGCDVFGDKDRSHSRSVVKQLSEVTEDIDSSEEVNCGSDAEVAKMAEMDAAEYVKKR